MFENTSRAHLLVAGLLIVSAAAGGLAIAALSPSQTLPVGITTATGDSMGQDGPQATVYIDIKPEVGDVVVYKSGTEHVQHRIIADNPNGYVTQGDAESVPDQAVGHPYVTEQNTVGLVVLTVPVETLLLGTGIIGFLIAALGTGSIIRRSRLEDGNPELDSQQREFTRLKSQTRAVALAVLLVLSIVPAGAVADTSTTSPAATDGPTFEDTSASENLTVVATAGNEEWSFTEPTGPVGPSSPTIVDGVAYVGSQDNNIYAVDIETGNKLWNVSTGDQVDTSPTVANGTLYVGSGDGTLYALDPDTGDQEWTYSAGSWIGSSPTYANGTVYVGDNGGSLYAVDAETGQEEWAFTTPTNNVRTPIVENGTVYVPSDDNNLYAINASDGSQEWSFSGGNQFTDAVTIQNGIIYAPNYDNNLYAVHASNGTESWSYNAGNTLRSGATVANGTVYAGGETNSLHAVDATSGSEEWVFSAPSNVVVSSPTVSAGTVYVGSYDGNVYAVEESTGTEKWNFTTGDWVRSSPTVANGTLYVGSHDQTLYAIGTDHTDDSSGTREQYGTFGHVGDRVAGVASQNVSGQVTDRNESTITNADITISQNGSVVNTTTTNSTGEYSTQLQDGDYTIEASKDNYTTNSTTVTVAGSPVTADNITLERKKDISGTATSNTGDAVAADIYVYENDSLVTTTTANNAGAYTIGGLTQGNYTLVANKTDYLNASTTVSLGSSSVDGADLQMIGYGITGQVVACPASNPTCDDPRPVPNGTIVEYYGVVESNLNVSEAEDAEERAEEIRDRMREFDEQALGWEPNRDLKSGLFDNTDSEYIAVHNPSDWTGRTPDLDSPILQVPAGEQIALSVWDGSRSGIQDGTDNSLPGAVVDDTDIVVKQLNYRGEAQNERVISTDNTRSSYVGGDHDYAVTALPPGFYEVHPVGSNGTAYTIVVGDPDQMIHSINQDIRAYNEDLNQTAQEYTQRAQEIRERIANDTVIGGTTTTGTDNAGRRGTFNFTFSNKSVSVVAVQAYTPATAAYGIDDPTNASVEDLRQLANSGAYNGTFYITPAPQDVRVPAQAEVRTVEVGTAPMMDPGRYANLTSWLNDYFANNSQMFAGAPIEVADWQSFLELRNRYMGMVEDNPNAVAYMGEQYPQYVNGETLVMERASATENVSREQARTYVTQTEALADALRHAPISMDPEEVEQSVDESASQYSDTITTGRHADTLDELTVQAEFADGSTENVSDEYLSLHTLASGGSTQLTISGYPVPEGKDLTGVKVSFDSAAAGSVDSDIQGASQTLTERISVAMDITKTDTDVVVNFADGTNRTLADGNWTLEDTDGPGATVSIDNWQVPAGKTTVSPVEIHPGTYTDVGTSVSNSSWLDATVEFGDDSTIGGPDFSAEDVIVVAKYQGQREEIPQDYWTVDDQLTSGSQIVIRDYPLPPNVANVDVEVIAASEAGIGRTTLNVENPGFTGMQPGIQGVPISTLNPGPDQWVTFSLTPEDRSTFGNISTAEVRAPDGSQIPTNVTNGEVEFKTNGQGAHTVSVRYTATDGSEFVETFDVQATNQQYDAPATLRARSSPNGLYVLAGDDLTNGQARLADGSTVEVATQIGVDADVPGEVHAHLEDVEEATRGQTMLRVVRGDDEQGIRDHVTYIVHTEGIPEEAYIYQGDTPIPESGSPNGEVRHNGSYTVITLVSGPDASASYTVVRNPTFRDKITWEVRMVMTKINVPVLFASPTGLGTGGTVLGVLFVFGYRRRGRGGRPLAGRVPDPLEASG
jgi:outer membrane protein assembly factor BamB